MTKPASPDPDIAWEAIVRRDRAFDGRFVYAVSSTGIFCRPSCPSRRARRDRVAFFPEPSAARAAGFRACRRCHPEQPAEDPALKAVARTRALLDAAGEKAVPLGELAAMVGVSPWHLQRTFKRIVGLSPREYQQAARAGRLKEGLRREPSVSRATYEAGYGSSSRVYERAGQLLGMTPGAYRRGGARMAIRYTVVPSPLGRLLVGVTDRGVCAVALGDSDTSLVRELRSEFPRAEVTRVDDGADAWLTSLVGLQGTAFQWKVWQALQRIPAGETVSYQSLARRLRRPKAARAVAGACAANKVAVVVPCHRVIRGDGSLGGYRWGLPRKERLLRDEGAIPA